MVILSIDFQDGFLEDTIVLHVDGEEVFHKEYVSTKLLLGLADSLKAEVETGSISIEVNVPTKGIRKTIVIDASADTYIGLSIVNDTIEHIVSDEPFGYG